MGGKATQAMRWLVRWWRVGTRPQTPAWTVGPVAPHGCCCCATDHGEVEALRARCEALKVEREDLRSQIRDVGHILWDNASSPTEWCQTAWEGALYSSRALMDRGKGAPGAAS